MTRTWPQHAELIKTELLEIGELDQSACQRLVSSVHDKLLEDEEGGDISMVKIEVIWMQLRAARSAAAGVAIDRLPEVVGEAFERTLQKPALALNHLLFESPVLLAEAPADVAKMTAHKYPNRNSAVALQELVDCEAFLRQRPGAVFVDFTVVSAQDGSTRYAVLVQKGDGYVQALDLANTMFVDRMVEEFRTSVQASLKEKPRFLGLALRKTLLDPVLTASKDLSPRHLLISPFQKLSQLSFAMLPQDQEHRYVVDMEATISYVHAASEWRMLAERARIRPSRQSTALTLVSPEQARRGSAGVAVLKVIEQALDTETQTRSLENAREGAPEPGLGHPVVHCAFALRPADLQGVQWLKATQMLVHLPRVDEAAALAASAFSAGAATAVFSLLHMPDEAVAAVVEKLYPLLAEKHTVASAVKQAQIALRRAGACLQAWGGLVAYGSYDPLDLEPEGTRPEAPLPYLVKPVRAKCLTEKVALPDGLEALASELCATAFLNREAHKTRSLGIYVPELKAAGPALPEDSPTGVRVILEGRAEPDRRLKASELSAFVLMLLSTLEGAHSFGLYHGNLDPQHILWREDGCPLVAGFGAATDLHEWSADDPHQLASEAAVPLKPWAASGDFAAPEVRRAYQANPASLVATVRSDLWAFAKLVRHFSKDPLPDTWEVILDDCSSDKPERRAISFAAVKERFLNVVPAEKRWPFALPAKVPQDQHAVVTGVYRLVYDRRRALNLRGAEALQAVFPVRQLAHLLARAHSVVGSQQAETCARQALDLAQRLTGRADPPEAADSLYHLGLAHLRRGRLADSEAALRESLRLHGAPLELGPDVPQAQAIEASHQLAATYQALSSVLLRRGFLLAANASADHALRTWKALHSNTPHPGTAASLYHLGILLLERGETHKAEEMARESLIMAESVYGKVHRAPAASWHLLGSILLKDNKPVEAEQAAQQSLEIRERLHGGAAHPDVAASLLLLGSVRDRGGKLEAAEEALLKALDMMQRLRGTDADLEISSAYRRLGSLRLIQGKPEQAEVDMKEALKKSREVHGNNPHPDTIAALHTVAVLHFVQHKYQEAKEEVQQAQQFQQALHGAAAAPHPRTKDLENLLAEIEAAATGKKPAPQLLQREPTADGEVEPVEPAARHQPAAENVPAGDEPSPLRLSDVRIVERASQQEAAEALGGLPAFVDDFPEFRDQWQRISAAKGAMEDAGFWPESIMMTWYSLRDKDPAKVRAALQKLGEWSGRAVPGEEGKLALQLALQLRSVQAALDGRLAEASARKLQLGATATTAAATSPLSDDQALAQLSRCDPGTSVAALYWRGIAARDAGASLRAERAFRAALDVYEDSHAVDEEARGALHFELGQVLAQQGRLQEAERQLALAAAEQQKPSGAQILQALAAVQCERGMLLDAEASAQRALAQCLKGTTQHPFTGQVLVVMGEIMRRSNKFKECESYAERALEFFAQQPAAPGKLVGCEKARQMLAHSRREHSPTVQGAGNGLPDGREHQYLVSQLRHAVAALAKHNKEAAVFCGTAESGGLGGVLSQTMRQVTDACSDVFPSLAADSLPSN